MSPLHFPPRIAIDFSALQIAHRRDVDEKPTIVKKSSVIKAASPVKPLQEVPKAGGRSIKFTHVADDATRKKGLSQDDIIMKTDVEEGKYESDSSLEYMN